jgi:hypothetical protein
MMLVSSIDRPPRDLQYPHEEEFLPAGERIDGGQLGDAICYSAYIMEVV